MEEKILDELLKNTFTLEAFRRRAQALKKRIEGEIYSEKEVSEEGKVSKVSKGEEWIEGFDMDLLKRVKNDDFVRLNEYIENFIKETQTLSIYFVFVPERGQLQEVGTWLRTNLKNPRLIFDIKVDPALIGGCAIAYKGVYKDYSLRAKISANKEKLIHEFREYFKQ